MEHKEITMKPNDNTWKIVLTIVCLGVLGYGFLYSKNTTADIAYLIGYKLPFALTIWGIFYAAVARKRGAKIGGVSFLAIFICMIASGLIGYSMQKQEAKLVLSEIQDQYSKMIESATDSEGIPKRIEKPINTIPQAHGEFGEMEGFMKDFMNQMVSQRNDYLLELEAIGWNKILDAERIKADNALIESKFIIRKAMEIVDKYQNKTDVFLNGARENIRSLNISESLKSEMLAGFEQGVDKAEGKIDEMWALDRKAIGEIENIISLLSVRKNVWVVEGGQILFYNYDDLKMFNSYIASIQNIADQQQQIQKQSTETVNRNLNRIKEEMK